MFMKRLVFDAVRKRYSAGSVLSTLIESSIRFLQFVLGVAVIGLYAQDLVRAKSNGDPLDSKWLFATIVGSIAALASLIYLALPCITRQPLSLVTILHLPSVIHDAILSILWITVFGIFRHKFYQDDEDDSDEEDGGGLVNRMQNAVWVDLACFALWMITFAWCGVRWWRARKEAKRGEEKYDDYGSPRGHDMDDV